MSTTCYYCGIRQANPSLAHKVPMYKKIDSSYGLGLTGIKKTTKFYQKDIEVDRCADCKTEHDKANKPLIIICLGSLVVFGTLGYLTGKRVWVAIVAAIAGAAISCAAYMMGVHRKRLRAMGIRDAAEVKEFPAIAALRAEGWDNFKPG